MIKHCRVVSAFWSNRIGGPLAEFSLLIPFFMALIFGTFEAGRVLYYQNILTRSVHDAARFAARHPDVIDPNSCQPGGNWSNVQTDALEILRNGRLGATTAIMPNMSHADAIITVTVACVAPAGDMVTSNPAAGANVPIVVASAQVPVVNLGFFTFIGKNSGFAISAEHRELAIGL